MRRGDRLRRDVGCGIIGRVGRHLPLGHRRRSLAAGWRFEFGRRHGAIAEAAAAASSRGNAVQQVLRLGIERPIRDRQVRGVVGQSFGVVEFFPQQQRLGLREKQVDLPAAVSLAVLGNAQLHELGLLLNRGLDLGGVVFVQIVATPKALA